ncbi:alpha/beta fold hydrolase [Kocuria sp. M1R5S2]|uniref:alpha/beta fold hydrolase n=1 Tax=Kocuria rhizosphaerae TaxID=3376285 RepID=UPI00378901E4
MGFQPDFTQGTVRVAGGDVRYYDSGPVDDRQGTIVLIHGTGGSAYGSFWALMPMLSFKYKVVALDLTDVRGEDTTVSDYVEQTLAVIDATTSTPVTVVGYSLGAVVAATLASERPDVVSNLVLVAGWLATDQHQLLRNDLWFRLRDEAPGLLGEFTVLTSFSHRFLSSKTAPEIAGLVEGVQNGPDRSVKMLLNRAVDLTDAASRIHARTLVIGCTEDLMVPVAHSYALYAAIPNATFVEIRSGHSVMHERPAEVFKRIHDFVLDRTPHLEGTVLPPIHA